MAQTVRLDDAMEAYVAHLRGKEKAKNTVRSAQGFLNALLTETGNIYVKSLEAKHVDALLATKSGDWSKPTKGLALQHLRSFVKFCQARGWYSKVKDPFAHLSIRRRGPQGPDRLRVPVERFSELLDAVEHPRDRMVLALGLYLFLRQSEIKTIRLRDVDLDLGEIAVTIHKSEKHDIMPIPAELDRELRRYLTWYSERHPRMEPSWFLVPAKAGGHPVRGETGRIVGHDPTIFASLRPSTMLRTPEKIVQRALQSLGYDTFKEGIHTLRRSGARALYDHLAAEGTTDSALEMVSTMLHHEQMSTTQLYLGIDTSRRKRDALLKGKPMFPALVAENVIPLRREVADG